MTNSLMFLLLNFLLFFLSLYKKKYLFKLLIELSIDKTFKLMIDLMKFEIFLQQILDFICLNNPSCWLLFNFLLFLNHIFWCIDFNLIELISFNSFCYFWLWLLFLFNIFFNINKRIISLFLIIINFSFLCNLTLI